VEANSDKMVLMFGGFGFEFFPEDNGPKEAVHTFQYRSSLAPVKSLMDRGVIVVLATDCPVDQINPFGHMESAYTRIHLLGKAQGHSGRIRPSHVRMRSRPTH
jgi:predicted amidohydrolase YtcJ